jgi:hypothetical protein
MHAYDPTRAPSSSSARLASLLCITFAFALHGTRLKWGIRLQNALGAFKLFILIGIAGSGLAVLVGIPGFRLENVSSLSLASNKPGLKVFNQPPKNFEWQTMWKGSGSGGANAFVTGLYNVIWSALISSLPY